MKVIHEGAGHVKRAVTGLGWLGGGSPAATRPCAEKLQSSIRSRWADQVPQLPPRPDHARPDRVADLRCSSRSRAAPRRGRGSGRRDHPASGSTAIDTRLTKTSARCGRARSTSWRGRVPNQTSSTAQSTRTPTGAHQRTIRMATNYRYVATKLTAGFHTYAVKWTPTQVTWYLDGRRAHSAQTYPADNQPMFVLLQMWSGGWTKDPTQRRPTCSRRRPIGCGSARKSH
jgi:glycosyl hydrolase family 16